MCRYAIRGWVRKINYHAIHQHSTYCFFACEVTPTYRLGNEKYKVWLAVHKQSELQMGGAIHSAYCTCPAGCVLLYTIALCPNNTFILTKEPLDCQI